MANTWISTKMADVALVGIPAACLLTGYVGFLFGAVKANPWWSTPLMPVIFVASALVSDLGVTMLLYQITSWWRVERSDETCLRTLANYLWVALEC